MSDLSSGAGSRAGWPSSTLQAASGDIALLKRHELGRAPERHLGEPFQPRVKAFQAAMEALVPLPRGILRPIELLLKLVQARLERGEAEIVGVQALGGG